MSEAQFLKTTVILPVASIPASTEWYQRTLGFVILYVHSQRGQDVNFANYAILVRDAVDVHLILDEGGPAWTRAGIGHLSLTVRNIDAVYAEVMASGVAITRDLQVQNWPARGFDLTDPSGNHVHVEQPLNT